MTHPAEHARAGILGGILQHPRQHHNVTLTTNIILETCVTDARCLLSII